MKNAKAEIEVNKPKKHKNKHHNNHINNNQTVNYQPLTYQASEQEETVKQIKKYTAKTQINSQLIENIPTTNSTKNGKITEQENTK